MKPSLSDVLSIIALAVCVILLVAHTVMMYGSAHTVRYDCRLAEISPDFPTDVRNECRKLRINYNANKR